MKDKDREFARYLRKIARESEMEERAEKGGPIFRSKTWDTTPSHKQERRSFKQRINQFLDLAEELEDL